MVTYSMWVFTPMKPEMAQVSYLTVCGAGWGGTADTYCVQNIVCMSVTGKRLYRFQGFQRC